MVVTVEFTIPTDAFTFGRSVSGDPNVTVTLEAVVPLGDGRIPFVWATNENSGEFNQFEQHLRNSDVVKQAAALTRVGDSVLYRVDWKTGEETFLNGLSEADGAIVEGHANEVCSFTIRFKNHADLTRFHQFYQSHEYPVHIDRVYTLDEEPGRDFGFDLTPAQRETLVQAVENGYFGVPRETKLDEIADELDISRQAASERVRRGTEQVLRKALLGLSASDLAATDDE